MTPQASAKTKAAASTGKAAQSIEYATSPDGAGTHISTAPFPLR